MWKVERTEVFAFARLHKQQCTKSRNMVMIDSEERGKECFTVIEHALRDRWQFIRRCYFVDSIDFHPLILIQY